MNEIVYREFNFENIVLGTLASFQCGGLMKCSTTEEAFQIEFFSQTSDVFTLVIPIIDIKKIFKSVDQDHMTLDFKLKPAAIQSVGESLRETKYVFQISRNQDECKFQLCLNDINSEDVSFIDNFFSSIDIFDENVGKVVKEVENHQEEKIQKPLILKHRKKKFLSSDPEDGSEDYQPQKKPRKQSFSKVEDYDMMDEAPKRSLRARNEVNFCEEMTEEAQLQEALKRSLKGVDQNVIESLSLIEDPKSEKELEHQQLYGNIDKTIELFTYNTSNGSIIVRMEDYLCLSRNEYLSDVNIDFYLNYIYNVKMTPEQREKTLIIGSHFYTLYSTTSDYSGWNDGINAGLNAKEKRYRRIDGILKDDVNIFEKDFIIMPLLDNNHWFLAIVCFPKLNGSYTLDDNVKVEGDDAKRNPKKPFQPPIKSSCILIFDSIKGNGSRRTVAINHIKNFLEYEWINKYQHELYFDVKSMPGHSPKVPLQLNNFDCGCFILEFMERFFVTSPIDDFRFPIDLADWFSPEEVRYSKRREIAELMRTMIESSGTEVELPNIRFYGDRKKNTSSPEQVIDLDNSIDDKNGNSGNRLDITENGNGNENENGSNGNNNDENFNNNNDFNCLDSNNTLQNGSVIQENREIEHNITRDDFIIEDDPNNVERVTTQEMKAYEQECYFSDEDKTESIALNTSDEMEVDKTVQSESEICQGTIEPAKQEENDGKVSECDKNVENNVTEQVEVENNNEKADGNDAIIPKQDETVDENDAKMESDIEKIDLTLEEDDTEEEKADLKVDNDKSKEEQISENLVAEQMDMDPEEQSDDQEPDMKEQVKKKPINEQSIADRLSQSINLKEATTVLID